MKYFQKSLSLGLAAPLILCAGAAVAQDGAAAAPVGACGQPIALNSQPMTLQAVPTEMSGGLVEIRRNEPRYVEMTIGAPMAIAVTTLATDRDMTLILFNEKGEVVESDDDSGENGNAQMIAKLEPGVYCAQIAVYGGMDAATFVSPFAVSAAPPADACIKNAAPAVDLRQGSDEIISTGVLSGKANVAFNLAAGTSLSIAARSPMFDTFLTLQDEFGREILTDDDSGGDTNSLIQLDAGESDAQYCVSLTSLTEESGIYSLAISPATDGAAAQDQGALEDAAEAVDEAEAAAQEAVDTATAAAEAAAAAADAAAADAADDAADAVPPAPAPAQ